MRSWLAMYPLLLPYYIVPGLLRHTKRIVTFGHTSGLFPSFHTTEYMNPCSICLSSKDKGLVAPKFHHKIPPIRCGGLAAKTLQLLRSPISTSMRPGPQNHPKRTANRERKGAVGAGQLPIPVTRSDHIKILIIRGDMYTTFV